MTLGEEEAVTNPSASIRHHYSMQHPNWYMPDNFYTVTFDFATNMTLADGTIEEERFNVTVVNLDTWSLFNGNPLGKCAELLRKAAFRQRWSFLGYFGDLVCTGASGALVGYTSMGDGVCNSERLSRSCSSGSLSQRKRLSCATAPWSP